MTSNFLTFDENNLNIESDSDYEADPQRLNGVVPGMALSPVHNKLFRQVSIMTAAIGQFISNAGQSASDVNLNALVAAFTEAVKALGATTGDVKPSIQSTLSGWVLCNGQTIGNASSGANGRANSDCQNLFTLLWNQTANENIPIFTSTGAFSTRGVSASADWSANKRLLLPDLRGRAIIGLDNMGGAGAAGRVIANASNGSFAASAMCAAGGEGTHVQTIAEMANHDHTMNYSPDATANGSSNHPNPNGYGAFVKTSNKTGSSSPMNIVQPSIALNYFIKL